MPGKPLDKPYMHKLGKEGNAWVRECLELTKVFDNDETFTRDVLAKTNLEKGEVYIAIAAVEHDEALTGGQPLKWGRFQLGSHNMDMQAEILLAKLKQVANECGSISIVNEDFMPIHNEPVEKYPASEIYQLHKQFLYIKNLSNIETASELVDHLCHNFLLSAYIVPSKDVPSKNTLSNADADKLADSVIGIINFAYDGETFTLWLSNSY